jgi:RNase adaptor protein for sRNA GlmZ degradation
MKLVAFNGRSGSGKSTAATYFAGHGFKLVPSSVSECDLAHDKKYVIDGIQTRSEYWKLKQLGCVVIDLHRNSSTDTDVPYVGEPDFNVENNSSFDITAHTLKYIIK